jgi:hypothetical protein
VSMARRVAIGEVRLAGLLHSSSGHHGRLVISDRPRAIDRYIDYFGDPVHRSGTSWFADRTPARQSHITRGGGPRPVV